MRLKSPSLALIYLLKLEKAYRQGIDIRLHVGTSLEHLYPQEGHLLIWEASWDLALKMASNGKPLEVRLEEREKGYRLVFTTQPPLMLDASELLYLQDLCQKMEWTF